MTDPYADLINDLAAEHAALDLVVAALGADDWERPTPSPGWTVRDQIGHLHHFDGTALQSVVDPAAFVADRDAMMASLLEPGADPNALDRHTLAFARGATTEELLAAWRQDRDALVQALAALDPKDRLEWYGPPMSAMSFATARLMETWAHGQDAVDALGADRPPTDRVRHVAHLGVRTRTFTYVLRGREAPTADVRVELVSPSGETWEWGPTDAIDRVAGPAVDFCLVVTQRRHPADTALTIEGPAATDWMAIAQAFAGLPTEGPPPRP